MRFLCDTLRVNKVDVILIFSIDKVAIYVYKWEEINVVDLNIVVRKLLELETLFVSFNKIMPRSELMNWLKWNN